MAKSPAQILRQGFAQRYPESTQEQAPEPATFYTLDGRGADMFAPVPTSAPELTSQYNPSAITLNAESLPFTPLHTIPGQTEQETRLEGLSAYVTQDLTPSSADTAKRIFGQTPPFANDHNANMAVGRAVASAHGYTGDPALFLREKGSDLGYAYPADLSDEFQLYAHIGETFTNAERKKAQELTASQNKELALNDDELNNILPKALMKAVQGEKMSPREHEVYSRANIPSRSIRNVQYLMQSGKLPGITRGWRKAVNSKFNEMEIDEIADALADDPIARFLVLELARKEGYTARENAHDRDGIIRFGKAIIESHHNLKEPFVHALKEVGSGVSTFVNDILSGNASINPHDKNFFLSLTDEEDERRRRAFRHDFTQAYNVGYNQRTEELSNHLKGSFSFKAANLLTTAADITGNTLPYLHPVTAAFALGGMASDEMNKAASNALHAGALDSASGWELYGAPAVKTGIFGGSIALTGGIARGAIGLASRTAIGKAAASRIAISPLAGYTARFAEGTATEAGEELANALGQEAFELTGLVEDRQKEQHMGQLAATMTSPEFWGGNIAMNLGLAAFGLKGSRSKAPYLALQELRELGFTFKEARRIALDVQSAVQNGASPNQATNIVSDAIRMKMTSAPEATQKKLQKAADSMAARMAIEDAAASGVRDYLLKEANISDMERLPNGKIKAKVLTHNDAGEFESVEQEMTDQQLNDYLLANLDSSITKEILRVQALVRGEKLAQAAQAAKDSPFARIASLQDAPAEVLAQLKGSDTFNEDTLKIFAEYALNRFNQDPNALFGDTGIPVLNVANVPTNFAKRTDIAREKGEIKPDERPESTAFILPSKTVGDNILLLARGQADAHSIAHDWLEGFARARYDVDPTYWRDVLDSVDRELLQNKVTSKSLFAKPEGQREDSDYIEAFTDLASQSWLANHDAINLNATTHAIADEMLEDLGSIQNGLAVAQELSRFLESDAAKKAIGEGLDPLRDILTKAGASLTDLAKAADDAAPKSAADFVLQHRQRMMQEIDDLANAANELDSAPPMPVVPPNLELQNTPSGISAPDGTPLTVRDVALHNDINPVTGTLNVPPPTAISSTTAPKTTGKGLAGGIAYINPDRTIEGVASLSALTLHPSLAHVNLSKAHGLKDTPVICYRSADGSFQVIGGFARLAHDQELSLPKTRVIIYPSSRTYTKQWAAKKAIENAISDGIASTLDNLKYLLKYKPTFDEALEQDLIPEDIYLDATPTARAAWLLYLHADPQTTADYISGSISLNEALKQAYDKPVDPLSPVASDINQVFDLGDSLLDNKKLFNEEGIFQAQNALITKPTASFSIRASKPKRRYTKLKDMVQHEQFMILLDEAKRLERQATNFISPEMNLDKLLINSAKLNGLLQAIHSLLPKDALPWKLLPHLEGRFKAYGRMAINSHLPFDTNADYAKYFNVDEVERYNAYTPEQRRNYIADRLASSYDNLLKSTAKSLEAYLSRSLIDQVERAIKTLQPKLQASGKEKRGITSGEVFRKAMKFYDMMAWSPAQVSTKQNELLAQQLDKNISEEAADTIQRELNALNLFGALRYADLAQTQRAVTYFMDFIEQGKADWRDHLAEESEAARQIRLAVAKLRPNVPTSAVNKKSQSRKRLAGRIFDSFTNPVQILYSLGSIKGKAGDYFQKTAENLSVSLDRTYLNIETAKNNAYAILDSILGLEGKPAIVRDAARAKFIADAKQHKQPDIWRDGTIPVFNYRFTQQDVNYLADLKGKVDKKAFAEAVNKHFSGSNIEVDISKRPFMRALKDAISRTKEKTYQGGEIFIQIYEKRDSAHADRLDLTPLQAANIVLMAEQPSYANKYEDLGEDADGNDLGSKLVELGTMDINGYTEGVLSQLESYAGPELMTWLRQLRNFFNKTGLFEAYEKQTGLPFPQEENYWPGMFETPKQGSMVDALDAASKGQGVHQMLIKRRDHISPPNINVDALDAWERTITQHYFYIHISPITRELRRVFRNNDFITRLKDIAPTQSIENLIQFFDTLDGAPNLCLRASQPLNEIHALLTGKHAVATLSGMTPSATKNLTGYLNGTAYKGINVFNLIYYTIKGLTSFGHASPADVAKLPVFQNRLHRDSLAKDAQRLANDEKQTAFHAFGLYGMRWAMEYPDYGANLLSMTAVYNKHYDTLLKALKDTHGKNYTPTPEDIKQIKDECEKAVSTTMHRAAQPMEKTDKSAFLQTQNWAQNISTYMKGEILIKLGLARSAYNARLNEILSSIPNPTPAQKRLARIKATMHFYKYLATASLAGQGIGALLTDLTGGAPEDEDEYQNWLFANLVAGLVGFGLVTLIPGIGDALSSASQFVADKLTGNGKRGVFATYGTTGLGGLTFENIRNAYRVITGEISELSAGEQGLAFGDLARFLGTTISAVGAKSRACTAAGELLIGVSTILNATRPYFQHLKNKAKKEKRAAREAEQYRRRQNALLKKILKSTPTF